MKDLEGLKGLDEGLLRQVVGVLVVGRHVVNGGVDSLLVAAHQFVVGLQIALAGPGSPAPFPPWEPLSASLPGLSGAGSFPLPVPVRHNHITALRHSPSPLDLRARYSVNASNPHGRCVAGRPRRIWRAFSKY